ncbi:hypothetical protein VULLAG_LOCUS635 [Vulpes lagopus]
MGRFSEAAVRFANIQYNTQCSCRQVKCPSQCPGQLSLRSCSVNHKAGPEEEQRSLHQVNRKGRGGSRVATSPIYCDDHGSQAHHPRPRPHTPQATPSNLPSRLALLPPKST